MVPVDCFYLWVVGQSHVKVVISQILQRTIGGLWKYFIPMRPSKNVKTFLGPSFKCSRTGLLHSLHIPGKPTLRVKRARSSRLAAILCRSTGKKLLKGKQENRNEYCNDGLKLLRLNKSFASKSFCLMKMTLQ